MEKTPNLNTYVCIPVVTQAIAKLNYSFLRVDTPFCALFQIKMSFEIAKAGWMHRLSKWIFTFPEFEDRLRKDVESFFFSAVVADLGGLGRSPIPNLSRFHYQTRMHSSRMRTARSLTASRIGGGRRAWQGACMAGACVAGGGHAWHARPPPRQNS